MRQFQRQMQVRLAELTSRFWIPCLIIAYLIPDHLALAQNKNLELTEKLAPSVYRLIVARNDGSLFLGEAVAVSRTVLVATANTIENVVNAEIGPLDWKNGDQSTRLRILAAATEIGFAAFELDVGEIQSLEPMISANTAAGSEELSLIYLSDEIANQKLADELSTEAFRNTNPGGLNTNALFRQYGPIVNECGQFIGLLQSDSSAQANGVLTAQEIILKLSQFGVRPRTTEEACSAARTTVFSVGSMNIDEHERKKAEDRTQLREDIEKIQDGLSQLGFFRGDANGEMSEELGSSVASFALNRKLSLSQDNIEGIILAVEEAVSESSNDPQSQLSNSAAPSEDSDRVRLATPTLLFVASFLLVFIVTFFFVFRTRWIVVHLPDSDYNDLALQTRYLNVSVSTRGAEDTYFLVEFSPSPNRQHVATIGRSQDNDIAIPNQSISRKHTAILIDGDDIYVEDLASSNGTVVLGARQDAHKPVQLPENGEFKISDLSISAKIVLMRPPSLVNTT